MKGWRLSGITRFSTGLPVTLIETDDNSLLGTSSAGAISLPIDRPNVIPNRRRSPIRAPAYRTSTRHVYSGNDRNLGNARRRFFAGPGLNNWDVALLKDTLIKESLNLEFRAELFNAFNHAQFGQPDGNVDDLDRSALFTPQIRRASCSSRSNYSSKRAELYLRRTRWSAAKWTI